jgi:hypothetical protein
MHCPGSKQPTCGLGHALQVVLRHAPRAEDAAVRKVLRAQVTYGQPAQHNLRAARCTLGQLVVDDVPLWWQQQQQQKRQQERTAAGL